MNEPKLNDHLYQNLEPFMTQSTDGTESNKSDSIDPEDDCWLAVINTDVDKIVYIKRKQ